MMFLFAIACTGASQVLSTSTDGGTWTVSIPAPPEDHGEVALGFLVEPADGALSSLVATMPDMGHTDDGAITDDGSGQFTASVNLSMAGWWVLDGEVTDGASTETFRLELEVF
jgi:hypothetical protein